MRSFLIALQFLTIVPVRLSTPFSNQENSQSLLYYPLVGMLLGGVLAALAYLLATSSPNFAAAIVVSLWVILTGGLHLDGLADSADAWLGGLGDKSRTLAIMKDPTCGPIGVLALILVILLKWAAIGEIIATHNWLGLVLSATLARAAMPLLFLTTDYARTQGLASPLCSRLPVRKIQIMLLLISILCLATSSISLLITTFLVLVLLRYLMERRLGGFTGDTAGATIEILEVSLLITSIGIS